MKIPIFLTDVRPGFVDTDILMGNKDKLFWVAPLDKACKQIIIAIERKRKIIGRLFIKIFEKESFHAGDFNFFWLNIRENLHSRLSNYFLE